MQIVRIGALDLHSGEFTNPQRPTRRHVDGAVDLRCVALGAGFGTTVANLVDDDLLAGADAALEAARQIACWRRMKRCQRSSLTSSGTAAARSLAAAPCTGS